MLFVVDKSIPLYIATGLSNDNQMGEDSITECVYENGIIRSYASWTTPRNPTGLNAIREGVVSTYIYLFYIVNKQISNDVNFSHKIL